MDLSSILTFASLALLLTLIPGADTMLVCRNVLGAGLRAGVATSIGGGVALPVHAAVSALGLSLVVLQSALAFDLVKTAGALYLIYLGLRTCWHQRRSTTDPATQHTKEDGRPTTRRMEWHRAFREGLFTNLLNPKTAIFYLATLPQFVRPGGSALAYSLLLAGIHASMAVSWRCLISLTVHWAGGAIQGTRLRRAEAWVGVALFALGVRLLFIHRPL